MIGVFNKRGGSVLATMTIEGPAISAYGVLAGSQDPDNARIYNCTGMVEKPRFEDAPSKLAIIGRYVLTPRIFEMIETITPGAGGELQLTDALRKLLEYEKIYGYVIEGKRHDAGDKLGFLKATVEYALQREDLGPAFREYLKSIDVDALSHGGK
jgi:UTP--glucose-1-phosphate uridylyltransferase